MSDSKAQARAYVLDPLVAPQPSEETGPGSHFRPTSASTQQSGLITPPENDNPFADNAQISTKRISSSAREIKPHAHPSPATYISHRPTRSGDGTGAFTPGHSRASSLGERFPGDNSHRPLDILIQEKSKADRVRHLTKKHHVQPDQVDRLDDAAAGGHYHHSGPYDATLWARNNSYTSAPVAATLPTDQEALKATPREKIEDSIRQHRPLDGVAAYPPGTTDREGRRYEYEEGDNMMIDNQPEGGAYKRWPGLTYHPDDIKGKSEPSYTIEKELEKSAESDMQGRRRSGQQVELNEISVDRSTSLSKRLGGGLKKRLGSIKRHSREHSKGE